MKKLLSTIILLSIFIAPVAMSAQKIGYVNATLLFNDYAVAKGIDKMIEKRFTAAKDELEKLVFDIQSLEKEIKTNELLMTENKLKSLKEKYQKMVISYREKGAALEKELKAVRKEEMGKFREIVMKVTKKFAVDNKYDLILNEGVMFASEAVNVTDKMSKLVNKAAE